MTSPAETVLVVEDDASIADFVTAALKEHGYVAAWARDGEEALMRFHQVSPQAVLLDLMLGRVSGLDVLSALRRVAALPVIVVSAKDDEEVIVEAFERGADDYITKPFSTRELLARLKANLRKSPTESGVTRLGELSVDWKRAEVSRAGMMIFLTAREFELLRFFFLNRELVVSRDLLLDRLWGHDYDGDARVVDTTIKRLRKKVGGSLIETVRGLGYRLSRSAAITP
jgi:two-component system response regulator VanR